MSRTLPIAANAFRYAGEVVNSPEREEQQVAPLKTDVPPVIIGRYFAWRVKHGRGRIDGENITVQTLKEEWQVIAKQIICEINKTWLPKDSADMRRVISTSR